MTTLISKKGLLSLALLASLGAGSQGCAQKPEGAAAEAEARAAAAEADRKKAQDEKTVADKSLAAKMAEIVGLQQDLERTKAQVAELQALKDRTVGEVDAAKAKAAATEAEARAKAGQTTDAALAEKKRIEDAVAARERSLVAEYEAKILALKGEYDAKQKQLTDAVAAANGKYESEKRAGEAKVAELQKNVKDLQTSITTLEATIRMLRWGGATGASASPGASTGASPAK